MIGLSWKRVPEQPDWSSERHKVTYSKCEAWIKHSSFVCCCVLEWFTPCVICRAHCKCLLYILILQMCQRPDERTLWATTVQKQTDLAFSVATIFHTCERCLDAGWWSSFIFLAQSKKKHARQVDWRLQGTSWRVWVCEWCVCVLCGPLTCPQCTSASPPVAAGMNTSKINEWADWNISIYIPFANLSCCGFTPECYATSVSPTYSF